MPTTSQLSFFFLKRRDGEGRRDSTQREMYPMEGTSTGYSFFPEEPLLEVATKPGSRFPEWVSSSPIPPWLLLLTFWANVVPMVDFTVALTCLFLHPP